MTAKNFEPSRSKAVSMPTDYDIQLLLFDKVEQWKDIPGYEGFYQASTLGRIRSLDRIIITVTGNQMSLKGRILAQDQRHHRKPPYFQVVLCRDGERHTKLVHNLVANTWLGPPTPGQETRHGANGFRDNAVSNLCYGTHSDNEKDKVRDGTAPQGVSNHGWKRSKTDRPERQAPLIAPGANRNPEFVGAPGEINLNIDWEHEPENEALDAALRTLADAEQVTHGGLTFWHP